MKRSRFLSALVGYMAVFTFVSTASAYFNPSMGRFLSRDPGPVVPMRLGAAGVATGGHFIQRDPYADGMNLYQYVGSNPVAFVDPFGLDRQIFAFEGLGGVSGISLPLMKTEWGPIAQKYGAFHYYAQDDVSSAVKEAVKLAKQPASSGKCYHTIVVLGYSNGGRAAIQFAEKLRNKNIKVELGFTADPIPKGLELVPPLIFFPSLFLHKPGNTDAWINYYQQTDKKTLGGFLGIRGHKVGGASNTKLTNLGDYGHIKIMLDLGVQNNLDTQLQSVPEWRSDWKYK